MAFVFKFPDVGEGIHEGRVVEWLVSENAIVAEDQALLKVETDKAVVELPSPRAGSVLRLHALAGATIEVGDPLVTLGEPGEQLADEAPAKADTSSADQAGAGGADPVLLETGGPPTSGDPRLHRPLATPRTRAIARRLGVDLTQVRGTGKNGRITDTDVEQAAASGPEDATRPAAAGSAQTTPAIRGPATARVVSGAAGEIERVPISHLRKVIADAMHRSKHSAAHVTHVEEADVTELMRRYREMKPAIQEQWGVRFTVLPFFIKALVAVLRRYPMFNASVDEEAGEILLKRYYNIGVAVDTPDGLIVPVIKAADRKSMVDLAAEVADLAERARERRLALDELRGGTCTITNIGPLGGVFATPIINQPELAIVGLHKIQERPVVVDGEIVVRSMMYLSISFDHRYIDGADAARFMTELAGLVASPDLLMARL